MNSNLPIAYTISGSDSSGGAGLQADLKVFSAFNVHGCSITTAITAQNTAGIDHIMHVPNNLVLAQFNSLISDLIPNVIKIGMLGKSVLSVGKIIRGISIPIVCDPVLSSTSGEKLLDQNLFDNFKEIICPECSILTPNILEAKLLLNNDNMHLEKMAANFLDLGVDAVLIKGGHNDSEICSDFFSDGENTFYLESPRIYTKATHGTGCILSSAIAASLAKQKSLVEAVIQAKTFLNFTLENSPEIGQGFGPSTINKLDNSSKYKPKIIIK